MVWPVWVSCSACSCCPACVVCSFCRGCACSLAGVPGLAGVSWPAGSACAAPSLEGAAVAGTVRGGTGVIDGEKPVCSSRDASSSSRVASSLSPLPVLSRVTVSFRLPVLLQLALPPRTPARPGRVSSCTAFSRASSPVPALLVPGNGRGDAPGAAPSLGAAGAGSSAVAPVPRQDDARGLACHGVPARDPREPRLPVSASVRGAGVLGSRSVPACVASVSVRKAGMLGTCSASLRLISVSVRGAGVLGACSGPSCVTSVSV